MQYYEILHKHPQHLHRFYHEISKVGRVGQDGVMRDFYTLDVSCCTWCVVEMSL